MPTKRIFLDYASITPLDSRVGKAMAEIQKNFWGNPSSLHSFGEEAKAILENARKEVAHFLHCRSSEIVFTSGGTEALNLAILGVIISPEDRLQGKLPHIIVSTIEHPAVLEPIKFLLKNKKAEVSFVSPDERGLINPESIKRELKENTVLVVVQHSNNEIGTIQPIRKIKDVIENYKLKIKNSSRPYLLVDASQSALYENVSLERLQADLLVLDGIKMYGPRGAGILVVRHGVQISPIMFGGGQESGLRSGTENVPAAVGLSNALEIAVKLREKEVARLTQLRDYAIKKILTEIPGSSLNGGLENRLPNNINICLAPPKLRVERGAKEGLLKIDSEFLVIKLDTLGFAVSAASACQTLSLENGSYVIESLSKPECASSSIRITLGRETKKSDLDKLIVALKKILC